MPKAKEDHPGFTTDYLHRCVICKRELDPEYVLTHLSCECRAFIIRVRLQPKQEQLLKYILDTGPEVPTKLFYFGGRAAGKSRGLRDITLIVMSECAPMYNGIPAYLMRRNWTQCQETLLEKFRIERSILADWYNGQEKQYTFPEAMGSPRIAFKYADSPEDVERLERGPECFFLALDQAEQWPELHLQKFNSPNRWPDTLPNAAKTAYFGNPGGPGSQYIKRVGYDRKFKDSERPDDFVAIYAYGFDNVFWFLNQGIEINGEPLTWELFYKLPGDVPPPVDGRYTDAWLRTLPEDNRFRLFVTKTSEGRKHWSKPDSIRMGDLFGSFSSFEGQYYSNWNDSRLVLR